MRGVFAGGDKSEAGSEVMTRFLLELAIYFLSFTMFGLFLVHVLERCARTITTGRSNANPLGEISGHNTNAACLWA